jgi:hypothetical protein
VDDGLKMRLARREDQLTRSSHWCQVAPRADVVAAVSKKSCELV